MANFLIQSEPEVANADAQEFAQDSATRLKNMSANALVGQYGPQAADPTMWSGAVNANTEQQISPLKVQQARQVVDAGALQADRAQRADQAWQGQHALAFIRKQIAGGADPATAVGNLTPATYAALGISPDKVSGLVDAVRQNPKVLDQIGDAISGPASQSKIVGQQPVWSKGDDGKYHMQYVSQGADGKLTYMEPGGLAAGQSLIGGTPTQVAAADAKGVAAGQKAAEYGSDIKPEDYFAAVKNIFPNAVMTGGGRSAGRNAAVGGAPNSMHLSNQALDFTVPGVDSATVFAKLRAANLPMSESLAEGQVGDQGPHLHVGWAPKATAAQKNAAAGVTSGGAASNLSDSALSDLYDRARASGKDPVFSGMGGMAMRAQYYEYQAQRDKATGGPQAAVSAMMAAKAAQVYRNDLVKATPNSNGGRVTAFNTLLEHSQVVQQLADALQNGNVQAINQAKNAYQTAFGKPAPNNLSLAASALGDEAAKAVAGNSAVFDRKSWGKSIPVNGSPAQITGAMDTIDRLAVGQLASMRQTAMSVNATDAFDGHLTGRAKSLLSAQQPQAPAATPRPAPGGYDPHAMRAKYGVH